MYIESVIAYICPYKFMQVSFLTTQFTLHQDTVLVPKMYVKCASKEPCYVAIYAAIKVFFLRVHYSVVVLSVVLSLVVARHTKESNCSATCKLKSLYFNPFCCTVYSLYCHIIFTRPPVPEDDEYADPNDALFCKTADNTLSQKDM